MTTPDFFRARLGAMIDLRHPLAVLAPRMLWVEIDSALAPCFAHKDRQGRPTEGLDLFGPTLQVAGAGTSEAGRPRLPIRLMVGLLYLKHASGESDESAVRQLSALMPSLNQRGRLTAQAEVLSLVRLALPRPEQPLIHRAQSGGNASVTCRSVSLDRKQQLPYAANANSRPKGDVQCLEKLTFNAQVRQLLLLNLSKYSMNELLGVGNPDIERGRRNCGNSMIAATGPGVGVCICAMNNLMAT